MLNVSLLMYLYFLVRSEESCCHTTVFMLLMSHLECMSEAGETLCAVPSARQAGTP